MASVMGLLEARETAAQVRVEELREEAERVLAELAEAEAVLERRAIARVELAEALARPEPEAGHPLESVPAKVEGVRSKVKRLVERGWLAEERPGVFTPRRAAGGEPECLHRPVDQAAGVAAVGPHQADLPVADAEPSQHAAGGIPVGHVGRRDQHRQQQA